MERATSAIWDRYYQQASARRRERGGDPITRLRRAHVMREARLLTGATLIMGLLVAGFYLVLI